MFNYSPQLGLLLLSDEVDKKRCPKNKEMAPLQGICQIKPVRRQPGYPFVETTSRIRGFVSTNLSNFATIEMCILQLGIIKQK